MSSFPSRTFWYSPKVNLFTRLMVLNKTSFLERTCGTISSNPTLRVRSWITVAQMLQWTRTTWYMTLKKLWPSSISAWIRISISVLERCIIFLIGLAISVASKESFWSFLVVYQASLAQYWHRSKKLKPSTSMTHLMHRAWRAIRINPSTSKN